MSPLLPQVMPPIVKRAALVADQTTRPVVEQMHLTAEPTTPLVAGKARRQKMVRPQVRAALRGKPVRPATQHRAPAGNAPHLLWLDKTLALVAREIGRAHV